MVSDWNNDMTALLVRGCTFWFASLLSVVYRTVNPRESRLKDDWIEAIGDRLQGCSRQHLRVGA